MNGQTPPKPDAAYLVIGLAATGLLAAGVTGLVSTFLHRDATGLIASALSFGTPGWLAGR
ncbi:MAG: hypothetical protein V4675_12050 [Verrucomicrobiota bacterium]